MPVTKAVTMFQARVIHGPVGLDIEEREWEAFGEPGSDFDSVLDEARQEFEAEQMTGILVIAEITTRYHVIV